MTLHRMIIAASIHGLLLVLFTIYLPKGILGAALDAWKNRTYSVCC